MKSILFLCAANVGRSQMAEGLARASFPEGWYIASAALSQDVGEKYAFRPHPEVTQMMSETLKIDISQQRVRQVAEFLEQPFDLVVNLTKQRFSLPLAWKRLYTYPIPDPHHEDAQTLKEGLKATLERLRGLMFHLKNQFEHEY